MHHIELARRDAITSKRVEWLEGLAVEHPDPRRTARGDVQEALLRIVRERGAGDGLAVAAMRRLAIAIDEDLIHVLAFERENLHALAAAIGHIDQPVFRHARGMHGRDELIGALARRLLGGDALIL